MSRVIKQIPVPEAYGDPDWDRIWCAWEDCGNPGSMLHREIACYGSMPHPRSQRCGQCKTYAFCSETHRGYWERSYYEPLKHGSLPAGVPPRYV